MRKTLMLLSLLTVAAAPLAARASDIITINLASGTYTLTVPSGTVTPSSYDVGAGYFELDGIAETGPGNTKSTDNVQFYVGGASSGGGLYDTLTPALNFTDANLLAMFTGPVSAPVFTLASFTGTQGSTSNNPSFTYSITSSSAVPEPSSLVLLGTGALGLAGSLRRRIFA